MRIKSKLKLQLLTFASGMLVTSFIFLSPINSASLELSPSSTSFINGCNYSIEVFVDPQGSTVNAAEFQLSYEGSKFEIIDALSTAGVQLEPSDEFPVVLGNNISEGTITYGAGVTPLTSVSQKTKIATIEFKAIGSVGQSGSMNFAVEGFGTQYTSDSNIANSVSNTDVLTSVINGNYNFIDGFCEDVGPVVNFDSPTNYAFNIDLNSNIVITISDNHQNSSGVDINSIEFIIDGITYKVGDSAVTYTGTSSSYTFTINPVSDFPNDIGISVIVKASDFAGNEAIETTVYNTVHICPTDPELICKDYIPEGDDGGNQDDDQSGNIFSEFWKVLTGKDSVFTFSITKDGLNTLSQITSVAILFAGIAPILLTALTTPGAFFQIFGIILGKKQTRPWGIIKDTFTNKPLPFAVCELYAQGSKYKITHVVSDFDGRYGFTVNPGSYRLVVKKPDYKEFSTNFSITSIQDQYVYDVALSPIGSTVGSRIPLTSKIRSFVFTRLNSLSNFLFTFGFAFSIIALIIEQSLINIVICTLYGVIILARIIRSLSKKSPYAMVVGTDSNLRIPYAQVKIFDLKTSKLIDTKMTNQDGYFDFYGLPGEYGVSVSSRGYVFPSSKNTFQTVSFGGQELAIVTLKRGGNKLSLFVDPIDGSQNISSVNIQSPFN